MTASTLATWKCTSCRGPVALPDARLIAGRCATCSGFPPASTLAGVCRADRPALHPLTPIEARELTADLAADGVPVTVQLGGPERGPVEVVLWTAGRAGDVADGSRAAARHPRHRLPRALGGGVMAYDVIERAAKMFALNTATSELTVLRDDGLYRHIVMARPDTGMYRYELVTWPGHLAVGGDMDYYVFSRVEDMFTFFRGQAINPSYWSEKVKDGGRDRTRRHSEEAFKARVMDELKHMPVPNLSDEQREARSELLERIADGDADFPETARELLADAEKAGLFSDTWEWSFGDWDFHFIYCLHAIVAGIKAYDAAKAGAR